MTVGSEQTMLIVLRGNSGSGKTTVSHALRDAFGRGLAWVSQDLISRIILKEKDVPGGVNIGLIDQVARYCLDHGQRSYWTGSWTPTATSRRWPGSTGTTSAARTSTTSTSAK
jgi:predicted ATPase